MGISNTFVLGTDLGMGWRSALQKLARHREVKSSEFYWRSRACPLAYIEWSEEETEKAPGNNRKFRRFYFMVPRLGSFPYRRPLQQPCRCIGSVWVTSRAKKCHRLEHCSRSRDIV